MHGIVRRVRALPANRRAQADDLRPERQARVRKTDINPDVVMALERSHSGPVPVKILAPELWRRTDRHEDGAPWFGHAPNHSRPARGTWSTPDVGFPKVSLSTWRTKVTPVMLAVLESFTLEDFAQATGTQVDVHAGPELDVRITLDVATTLNHIQRPYADAVAEHQASVELQRAAAEDRRTARARAEKLIPELDERFAKLGIKVKLKVTDQGRLPLVVMVTARSASFIAEMLEAALDDGLDGSSYVHDHQMHDREFARRTGLDST